MSSKTATQPVLTGHSRADLELMRVRQAVNKTDELQRIGHRYPWYHEKYAKIINDGFEGFKIHKPDRKVLPYWKETLCDNHGLNETAIVSNGKRTDQESVDKVNAIDGATYKVRHLKGRKCGAVEKVTPAEYEGLRHSALCNPNQPPVEPVPDDEPECAAVWPENIPSSLKKARDMAAKGLKKDPVDLSLEDISKFFKARANL